MTRQIIVADDHPLFREALKAAVGRLEPGTGFIEADSVASLLAAIEAEPDADLLLLDLHLPDLHGEEVLRRLRAERRTEGVVIVVLTADASADDHHIIGFPQSVHSTLPRQSCIIALYFFHHPQTAPPCPGTCRP